MEMRRRSFVMALLAWPLADATPLLAFGLSKRVCRAQCPAEYPGPSRPLDRTKIRQPGTWAG